MFDFLSEMEDSFYQVRLVTFQQQSGFTMAQSFALGSFVNQRLYQYAIALVGAGIVQRIQNLLVVNELFRNL